MSRTEPRLRRSRTPCVHRAPRPARAAARAFAAAAVAIAAAATFAGADDGPAPGPLPADAVRVVGAVDAPAALSPAHLAEALAAEVREVRLAAKSGEESVYRAVPLASVLRLAGLRLDATQKHHEQAFAVVAQARDGFTVTFSLAELDPAAPHPVCLAFAQASGPLGERERPARLVAPGQPGPRNAFAIERLVVLDGAAAARAGGGGGDAASRAGANAALAYWMASAQIERDRPTGGARIAAETPHLDAVAEGGDYPAALDDLLSTTAPALQQLARGAAAGSCDFGLDASLGPAAPLDHLARMRLAGKLLAAASAKAEAAGAWREAAERALDVVRLARHLDGDAVLVSSIHAAAIAEIGLRRLERIVARAPADAELLAAIAAGLGVQAGRVADVPRAWRRETDALSRWLLSLDARSLSRELLGAGEGGAAEALLRLRDRLTGSDKAMIAEGVHAYRAWARKAAAALEGPPAEREAAFAALEKQLAAPDTHPLLSILAAAGLPRMAARAEAAQAHALALAIAARLRLLASRGEPLPASLADAHWPRDPATGAAFGLVVTEREVEVRSAARTKGDGPAVAVRVPITAR